MLRDFRIPNFCNILCEEMHNAWGLAWQNFRRRKLCANVTLLDKFAEKWIARSEYAILPADKAGQFCLVKMSQLAQAHNEILQSDVYRYDHWATEINQQDFENVIVPQAKRVMFGILRHENSINAMDLL